MKTIILIPTILFLFSCANKKPKEIGQKVKEHESINSGTFIFKQIIIGDFNGDGIEDRMKETLISSISKKSVDVLPDAEYDSLVRYIVQKEPVLSLKSENKGIPELLISKEPSFGLLWIKNEGDLNQDGADEISLIINWADWSNVNTCRVYTLKNGKWKELTRFAIREWQLNSDENPDFNGFIKKNKKGEFEVLTFNSEMEEILTPLKKF